MNIEQIKQIAYQTGVDAPSDNLQAFANAIIKAYVAEQKPVGYIHDNGTEEFFLTKNCKDCIPLYDLKGE